MEKQRKQMHRNKAAWKTSGWYVRNCNQYSKCMHVSIFLCYSVTVLKSLNYACKNFTYAYICMKVYNLAGMRQLSTTVGFAEKKRQKQIVRFVSLHKLSGGSFRHTLLRGVLTDPWEMCKVASTLLLNLSLSLHSLGPGCLYLSPWLMTSQPGLLPTSGFQVGWFCSPGDIFVVVITRRMLLASSEYRSKMAIWPLSPSKDSLAPKVNSAMIEKLRSSHSLRWTLKSEARVVFFTF